MARLLKLHASISSEQRDFQADSVSTLEILSTLGLFLPDGKLNYSKLPFTPFDVTAGSESELQVAVYGSKDDVDLPVTIKSSNYYNNIVKRWQTGEVSKAKLSDLDEYLDNNSDNVWENSWVRFSPILLDTFTRRVLFKDLLANKKNKANGYRKDISRFIKIIDGVEMIRIPISYLIKLSLADIVGVQKELPISIRQTAIRLLKHYLNDNTSPETYSFYVMRLGPEAAGGSQVAKEKSIRFLLSSLLVSYANRKFQLEDTKQKAVVYFSPHPPIRQRYLNDIISDSFYRELFISPCLSGWQMGEEKYHYMVLCHQVLSRSRLNAISKLKEAGIINNNLVSLPNTSNISLANNGTHISLGSRILSNAFQENRVTKAHEKHLGDLAIKIIEHFLPLFVGTYSAAPYRLGFADFHPENALGFLPHELHYTHLRMLWRRWKKKAHINIFGQPVTPFGPKWLDNFIAATFRLSGDFVDDFRLIDYMAALLSTDQNPSLDGKVGNSERLKRDLAEMGVFDERMAVYQLYRLREYEKMGFSGFEGRYYSLFKSLRHDMTHAVNMQVLVSCLAFKYIAEQKLKHEMIPDSVFVESERRQIFFASAIGLPTFFVCSDTQNAFLRYILQYTEKTRSSRRYSGYIRVYAKEYNKALLKVLRKDAADLIEMWGFEEDLSDLEMRIEAPHLHSAKAKLLDGILGASSNKKAIRMEANEFNLAAERYYRNELRRQYLDEALGFVNEDIAAIEDNACALDSRLLHAVAYLSKRRNIKGLCNELRAKLLSDSLSIDEIKMLVNIILLVVLYNTALFENSEKESAAYASIYRAINW
ncbi:MAG: hypothetical protein ABWK15_08015 [Dissulfuribacterales bacterium]